MRDFSIDLIWAKIQGAITVIGGWLGYQSPARETTFAGLFL